MEKLKGIPVQLELTKHPEAVEMRENILKRAKLIGDDNRVLIQKTLEAGWDPRRVKKIVAELRECQKETEHTVQDFEAALH